MTEKHFVAPHLKEIEPAAVTDPRIAEVIQKLRELANDVRHDPEVKRSGIFQRLASSLAGKK